MVKNAKRNLYLSENLLSWNEMCCTADNHDYMCHTCAKEFSDSNFNKAVIDKILNFHEIAPNSTYSHKSWFFKYICNFLDQLLLPYKFHGRDMSGILLFIFASCEPLKWDNMAYDEIVYPMLGEKCVCVWGGVRGTCMHAFLQIAYWQKFPETWISCTNFERW